MANLKGDYQSFNKQQAEDHIFVLAEKWSQKYLLTVNSWWNNRENLFRYFTYIQAIHRSIYTTNAIEDFHL